MFAASQIHRRDAENVEEAMEINQLTEAIITGVPDPRVTNPELFDLRDPDAPIPQFVNAMRMAGIEASGEAQPIKGH